MWIITMFIGVASILYSEDMQSFSKYSNKNPVYEFVWGVSCENGLKSSGYSLVPAETLFFKQVNRDGSVGEVCED